MRSRFFSIDAIRVLREARTIFVTPAACVLRTARTICAARLVRTPLLALCFLTGGFGVFCGFSPVSAQTNQTSLPVNLTYSGGGNYTLVERTDLRRYDNGRYVGLVSREVRSFITRTSAPRNASSKASFYEGSFYVSEDTRRASVNVEEGLHDSIPAAFRITSSGELIMTEDHGYPTFRSFPAFTASSIKIGDKWQAKAERAVDPLNKGIPTKIPMYVEYTFLGETQSRGQDVYVLQAKWATRYGISYYDFGGDRDLKSAYGTHNATMHINKYTGYAEVVRDSVDETFEYTDGNKINFKGTISLFTEYPPAVDRSKIIPAIQRALALNDDEVQKLSEPLVKKGGEIARAEVPGSNVPGGGYGAGSGFGNSNGGASGVSGRGGASGNGGAAGGAGGKNGGYGSGGSSISGGSPAGRTSIASTLEKKISPEPNSPSKKSKDITVENTEAGIRLTMQNLRFKPDSEELLPGENERLDLIASLLKEIPQSQFLVEGHTASTGNPRGEQSLSELRAKSIAKELSRRGIQAGRFICKGSGSNKPVADNSTPEGKALNRRVEITILE